MIGPDPAELAEIFWAPKPVVAALFVSRSGPYFDHEWIDSWDIERDAMRYDGPFPVIAHPPCERWGRYWSGGPSAKVKKEKGADGGTFAKALSCVRKYGGVLEHPEASHAWRAFGLPRPSWHGGWTEPDQWGGRACCVAQGWYGHPARKMTWLYGVKIGFKELKWGPTPTRSGVRLDLGFHSKKERAAATKDQLKSKRTASRSNNLTPPEFAQLLFEMVTNVAPVADPRESRSRYGKE